LVLMASTGPLYLLNTEHMYSIIMATPAGSTSPSLGRSRLALSSLDGTQSNAWGPAFCPACSAPTLTRLLATASPLQQPRDHLAGRQRRLTCAVASAESSTE